MLCFITKDKIHKEGMASFAKGELYDTFRRIEVNEQGGDHAMEDENRVRLIDVGKLKPHPRNAEIYGEETVSDLVVQIEAYGGIADPLKIKEDFTIISGHRRWQAARELGMKEVPCQIVHYASEEEELAALVMLNYHRTKTNEQRAREGMVLEQALKTEGMERKLNALKQNQSVRDPGSPTDSSEKITDSSGDTNNGGKKGRTRDLVADAVNISSGKNFDRMKKVIVAADQLKADGKSDDAAFLIQMLDKSVKPASNLIDVGFVSLSDEEREHIRSGKIQINQFIAERLGKPKTKTSFRKIMKGISSAEQVLSDTIQAVNALNEGEIDELMKSLDGISAALTAITNEVKKQRKKTHG